VSCTDGVYDHNTVTGGQVVGVYGETDAADGYGIDLTDPLGHDISGNAGSSGNADISIQTDSTRGSSYALITSNVVTGTYSSAVDLPTRRRSSRTT